MSLRTASRIAATALVVSLVVAASASASTGAAISGAAWVTYPDFPTVGATTTELVAISARLLPTDGASGTIVQRSPFGDVRAQVDCLAVVGGDVYVGGPILAGFEYLGLSVTHLAFGIRDGGSDGDLVAGAIYVDRPLGFYACTPLTPFPPFFAATPGNFVVSTD